MNRGSAAAASAMPKRDDADVFVDVRNVKLNYKAGDSSTLALEQTNMTLKRGDEVIRVSLVLAGASTQSAPSEELPTQPATGK